MSAPIGVAFDAAGTFYVTSDIQHPGAQFTDESWIEKFAPDGTHLAHLGYTSGPIDANRAGISDPQGITLDAAGNIYVANGGIGSVMKLAPDGTLLGVVDTVGAGSTFESVAFDVSGNLYAAAVHGADGNTIQKIKLDGTKSLFATTMDTPFQLCFDRQGKLLVPELDAGVNIIQKFAADGTNLGVVANTQLYPQGLAIDSAGVLYESNGGANCLEAFPPGSVIANTPFQPEFIADES